MSKHVVKNRWDTTCVQGSWFYSPSYSENIDFIFYSWPILLPKPHVIGKLERHVCGGEGGNSNNYWYLSPLQFKEGLLGGLVSVDNAPFLYPSSSLFFSKMFCKCVRLGLVPLLQVEGAELPSIPFIAWGSSHLHGNVVVLLLLLLVLPGHWCLWPVHSPACDRVWWISCSLAFPTPFHWF